MRRKRGKVRRSSGQRGRYVFARPPAAGERCTDIAVDAALRAAALERALSGRLDAAGPAAGTGTGTHAAATNATATGNSAGTSREPRGAVRPAVERSHLRRKVRRRRDRHTVIFVLDTSDSMSDQNQLHVARIAVLSLLASAERRKDRVALITFADMQAQVALEPTSAIARARHAVDNLALGGATPLASGLYKALRMVESQRMREPGEPIEIMVFSDGEGNVSPSEPQQTIEAVGALSRRLDVHPIFIDTTGTRRGSRAMKDLAEVFGGSYRRLHGADGEELADMLSSIRRR